MPLFEEPEREIQEIERAQTRVRPAVSAQTADLLKAWRQTAPWMSPIVTTALASMGMDPNTEAGAAVMLASVKRKFLTGGFDPMRSIVHPVARGVTRAADFVAPEAVEDAVGVGMGPVKGTARVATTGFTSLLETAQGGVRNLAAATHGAVAGAVAGAGIGAVAGAPFAGIGAIPGAIVGGVAGGVLGFAADDQIEGEANADILSWSTGGQAIQQAARGESIDLGSGFFPGGRAREGQINASRNVTIDGRSLTPGRLFAAGVVEPGTEPYNVLSGLVDGYVAVSKLDPGSALLRAAGRANQGRKVFTAAGGVTGLRKTTLPEVVAEWKNGAGARVREWLAAEDDFDNIMRQTNWKLPVKAADQLADARTVDEVDAILDPLLGTVLRDKPTVSRMPEIRRRMDRVRLLQTMPGQHIDPNNLDEAVRTIDLYQKNARVPQEIIGVNNRLLAQATSPGEVYDVVLNRVLKEAIRGNIADTRGDRVARQLTKAWGSYHEDFARYFIDEIGENVAVPGAVIDATGKALPTPHLYVEGLHGTIPLPDAREIRRVTSRLGRIVDNNAFDFGVATGDWFMQSMWKPMVLLRGAWTVRVVGEEQLRIAAAGLSSLVSHPVDHIAMLVGGKGKKGLTGADLFDSVQGQAALAKGSAGFKTGNLIRTRYKTVYRRGDPEFAQSWSDELGQLAADPVAKRAAGGWSDGDLVPGGLTGNHIEDAKRWFWDGPGKTFREEMGEGWNRPDLMQRAGADAYIDTIARRLAIKTADDPHLLDAIAKGKLDGHAFTDRQAVDRLDALLDEGIGPEKVKGDLTVMARGTAGSKVTERLDKVTEALFNGLMAVPTNTLSRSPAFRQFYWRRVEELVGSMDDVGKTAAIDAALAGKAPNVEAIRRAASRSTGTLTLDDVDVLGKGFALDKTRDLLYDLNRRSQFFDVTRLLFPFGEAWKELLTTWAKIGVDNPQTIRRVQQTIQGLRQADPDNDGQGFFYTNANGDEVFAYPGSRWITEKLIGTPIPFEGRVQGLSVMTEVLPGFGPVVQIPASALIPETPSWDWVREIVLPFGESDTEAGFVESHFPAWLQKMKTSGWFKDVPGFSPTSEQVRALNNASFDLLTWQVSSGQRPRPSSQDEVVEALEDNMDKARMLYFLRGAAQFGAPTAPTPAMVFQDKTGKVLVINELRNEMQELIADTAGGGADTAMQRLLEKYGDAVFYALQAKSETAAIGLPVTAEANEWLRSNRGVEKRYPNTYGLFAPQGGEFDITAYSRQFESGERTGLKPEQMVQLANARMASLIYQEQRDALGSRPGKEGQRWLRELRQALEAEYPGFGEVPGYAGRVEPDTAIAELTRAAKNPELRATDAGQGLVQYLRARTLAQEDAESAGLAGFQQSSRMQPTRDWLREVADAIQQEHPDFVPMWEQVFDRELADEEPVEETA